MAGLRTLKHMLACGIVGAASAFAAIPAGALIAAPPAPASEVWLPDDRQGGSEARLQLAQWGRFCRWYPYHGLCRKLTILSRFCDRRPDHRLCDDHDDRFCRRHPYHPRCDDQPPSPS